MIRTQTPGKPASIVAKAESVVPFDTIEFLYNGEVLKSASASQSFPYSARLEFEMELSKPGWVAVRCGGLVRQPDILGEQTPFAHTSPVYVAPPEGPNSVQLPTAIASNT